LTYEHLIGYGVVSWPCCMIFGLWKRSETDSTKIVSYMASAAGVCVARVAYEDIRQAFGLPGVSNELLRARANARVTNKKALSEIATSG
jgi:hypothetical protein